MKEKFIFLWVSKTFAQSANTKLHSKDNAAARRRLRSRITDTSRKPTTQPTKLAKDRKRIQRGSAYQINYLPYR